MALNFIFLQLLFHFLVTVAGAELARAETGVSESEVLVGVSTALSGPASARAVAAKQGSDLYFKAVNESGGVLGRKIKILAYDDAYDPRKAFDNTEKLVEQDKAFLLFQYFGTAPTRAVLPLVEKSHIPLIAPQTGAQFLRASVMPQVLLTRPSYREEASEMVRFLVQERKLKSIAIFYQDDSFGEDGRTQTNAVMGDFGLIRTNEASYKRSDMQIDKAVETIRQGNPQAVIIWGVAVAAAKFMKACHDKGFHPVFAAGSSVNEPGFLSEVASLPMDIYIGQTVPFITHSPSKLLTEYIARSKGEGYTPNATAFEGYFSAAFLVEGLKAAGKNLTRAGLVAAFEKMGSRDLSGIPIHFSSTQHQALSKGSLLKVTAGKLSPAE